MAILRILRIDDPEDKQILTRPCRPIKLPDTGLKRLIADMFETMHHHDGVGLAAPQIGLSIALTVIWIPATIETLDDGSEVETAPEQRYTLINPKIVQMSKEEIIRNEGCLSLPEWYGKVPRAAWVTVEYQEPNGKRRRLRKVDGLLGWAAQHEIDHLHGILFIDRMDPSTLRHIDELENETEDDETQEQNKTPHSAELPALA